MSSASSVSSASSASSAREGVSGSIGVGGYGFGFGFGGGEGGGGSSSRSNNGLVGLVGRGEVCTSSPPTPPPEIKVHATRAEFWRRRRFLG